MKQLMIHLLTLFLSTTVVFAQQTYYVSPKGSDTWSGTLPSAQQYDGPFATIQKAADVMQPGDNCLIRKGMYHETVRIKQSGTSGSPIQFEAYPGETVYVTGTDLVSDASWQVYKGSIFMADLSQLGAVNQVFIGMEHMEIARFPNNTSDNLMSAIWGEAQSAVAQEKPAFSEITDPILANAPNLSGGNLWLLTGHKWVSFSSKVESHSGNTISFVFPGKATNSAYTPKAGSNYFITGLIDCIDMDKEWIYHDSTKTLYFQTPSGVHPTQLDVAVRTRTWGLDGSGHDYIEIKNILFFAAAINFKNSENCVLEGLRIYYSVPFYAADAWANTETPQNGKYAAVQMGGQYNIIRNSEVAYSWGEGIVLSGTGNSAENCLVHDINWLCTDAAPIHTSGLDHIIRYNTIYNTGRSGIVHRKSKNLEIAYNNIYHCGLLTTDLGATYCYQTDGDGTTIHHNWVHDVMTDAHTAGIYLDNGSSNFIVHHNVVWNTDDLGIQTNLDAHNHEIYNNTIWNCSQAMGGGGGNEVLVNQKVYNNLSNSTAWFGTDIRQNLGLDDPKFVDPANGNFQLQANSPARDDYVIMTSLLNGGFENGTGGWSGAGSELLSVSNPVHSGNLAVLSYDRNHYWEGARQNITEVLKDYGPGEYTLEAWVMLSSGTTDGYLRFKLVDDDGDHYPGTRKECNSDSWTNLSYSTNISWKGSLREAVFELMTTDSDNDLNDFYIDDCALLTPVATDTTKPKGGIIIPGITDDVLDGKPDAGAYEFGGANDDWTAGSTLTPMEPGFISTINTKSDHPNHFHLSQNFPNPFNLKTKIRFQIKNKSQVVLKIYDVMGRCVRTLVDEQKSQGQYTIQWNGLDDSNKIVTSGIYIYRIQAIGIGETHTEYKKMILIK